MSVYLFTTTEIVLNQKRISFLLSHYLNTINTIITKPDELLTPYTIFIVHKCFDGWWLALAEQKWFT